MCSTFTPLESINFHSLRRGSRSKHEDDRLPGCSLSGARSTTREKKLRKVLKTLSFMLIIPGQVSGQIKVDRNLCQTFSKGDLVVACALALVTNPKPILLPILTCLVLPLFSHLLILPS